MLVKGISTKCRITMNNLNKNTFTENLQPDRETCLEKPKKSTDFPIMALRVCERATLESWKRHSYRVIVSLLVCRLGPSRLVFGLISVSTIFKRLIASCLEVSPKRSYFRPTAHLPRISQNEGPKTDKYFDNQPVRDTAFPNTFAISLSAAYAPKEVSPIKCRLPPDCAFCHPLNFFTLFLLTAAQILF